MREEIIQVFIKKESINTYQIEAKTNEINALTNDKLIKKMRKEKTGYAGFLADIITQNPNKKPTEQLIPKAAMEAFDQLEGWLC